jgi:serine/threonine-protein kinase
MAGLVIANRYLIGRTIGVGGMGFVYEAVDLQTGLDVALKALPPGASDPLKVRRLRREAAAATAVRSEHVCRVDYIGVESGTPFIVMERLHGHTLRTQIDNYGPPSVLESVSIVSQLLDGLAATHDAGVIHRDVKPSNVFLVDDGGELPRVKLIDFGLAKITTQAGHAGHTGHAEHAEVSVHAELTSAECVLGTLQYVAPEQLLRVGDLDERADVYAAGVTLFETLTGQRVYQGSQTDIMQEIILGEIPRASTWRSDLPPVLDDVLFMAMAKTRDRRFASARAFKRALLAAMDYSVVKESGICPTIVELSEDDLEDVTLGPPLTGALTGTGTLVSNGTTADDESAADDLPTLRPPPPSSYDDEPTVKFTIPPSPPIDYPIDFSTGGRSVPAHVRPSRRRGG